MKNEKQYQTEHRQLKRFVSNLVVKDQKCYYFLRSKCNKHQK